jgi:hypothetical protein
MRQSLSDKDKEKGAEKRRNNATSQGDERACGLLGTIELRMLWAKIHHGALLDMLWKSSCKFSRILFQMASEVTELMQIVLYLLLTLVGGAVVAVLSILLIILIATLSVWLAMQISSFKKRSKQET